MDVRNIRDTAPIVEHNGTVPVWWMVSSREMKDTTEGGFFELVNEFEVAGGGYVEPHSHPTHEFYYVMSGRGHHADRGRRAARSVRATSCTSRPTRSTPCARRPTTPRSTASASPSEFPGPGRSTTPTTDRPPLRSVTAGPTDRGPRTRNTPAARRRHRPAGRSGPRDGRRASVTTGVLSARAGSLSRPSSTRSSACSPTRIDAGRARGRCRRDG